MPAFRDGMWGELDRLGSKSAQPEVLEGKFPNVYTAQFLVCKMTNDPYRVIEDILQSI